MPRAGRTIQEGRDRREGVQSTRSRTFSLAYDDDGSGPTLVMLHGAWLSVESWRPQRERFAADHRVVVPDLRGHGRSGPGDRRRYSVDLFAADLEGLLDRIGVDRAVICGLSLGSMVAQAYAARNPERVAGIVLAGAVRTFPPVPIPRALKRLTSPIVPLGGSLSLAGTEPTVRALLAAVQVTTGRPWLAHDPEIRTEAFDTIAATPPAEFRKTFEALYRFEPPSLEAVSAPACVVYGEHEVPAVKRQGRALARRLDGNVVEVPGAAHLVNRDTPDVFDEALGGVLSAAGGPD